MTNDLQLLDAPYIDLLYHALAHMQVNNASNLYSEAYIREASAAMPSAKALREKMAALEAYYNEHFERLVPIGFLPFYATDNASARQLMLSYPDFTEEDRRCFVEPFLCAAEAETAVYLPWRQARMEKARPFVRAFKDDLVNSPVLQVLCRVTGKRSCAYLSYSMPCNGRGVIMNNVLCAMVAAPLSMDEVETSAMQLLHEYTHAWTDPMQEGAISMEDGSHDLTEAVVVVTDDWLFELHHPEKLAAYRAWCAHMLGVSDVPDRETLERLMGLPEAWQSRIERLTRATAGHAMGE